MARVIHGLRTSIPVKPFILLAARDGVFRMTDGYGTDFFPSDRRDVTRWNSGIDDPSILSIIVDFMEDRRAVINPRRVTAADAMAPRLRIVKILGCNEREGADVQPKVKANRYRASAI